MSLRKITIDWQSLAILGKVLLLILSTLIIPFLFAITFTFLLIMLFSIPALFLFNRWFSIIAMNEFNTGDMKVPTFYSTRQEGSEAGYISMSVAGVVFGGIHCAGWFFNFPSSDEAMLWRVSSVVLTGIAFLFPLVVYLFFYIPNRWGHKFFAFLTIIFLVYVVSRLLLLVEAFISLRNLTPGMLALVKWTSFIPHI